MNKISIVIPCLDEEKSVGSVVKHFKKQLPSADVYVFDNISQDKTADEAQKAGATVIFSPKKGKGTKAPIKDFQDPLLREEQV